VGGEERKPPIDSRDERARGWHFAAVAFCQFASDIENRRGVSHRISAADDDFVPVSIVCLRNCLRRSLGQLIGFLEFSPRPG
jgi:hypothetical protein